RFVFESSFLKTYEIDPEIVERIRHDDEALMHFSFKYLANALFGAEGMAISKEKLMAKVKVMQQEQEDNLRRIEEDYKKLKAEREAQKQS
ncbi:YkgJ family cysteine cluster protein, partial [Desulfobulbus sp. F3]|nr:YkgJ family cysteine cluster protein [Desulfobulbus sp. F3]